MNRYAIFLLTALAVAVTGCGSAAGDVGAVSGSLQVSHPMLMETAGMTDGSYRLIQAPDDDQAAVLRDSVAEFVALNAPRVTTTKDRDGNLIDRVVIGGRPPENFRMSPAPASNDVSGVIGNVPAFNWCYGCSATSGAMMAGYYDRGDYTDIYTGPTNGGLMPLNNATWGVGECPLSATHSGIDGRTARGHVDDYWVETESTAPDPYIAGGWAQHGYADCTADFMGTNQSALDNIDGSTTFYYYPSGAPVDDYTACEPAERDGGHGLRQFFESRGYTVVSNFNQYIYGYNGNTQGFTFDQYKAEIDAGRPVLIHVTNHTMLGFGYTADTSTIQIHDTWDHLNHTMTWGGSYSGLQHLGVTVIRLAPACACSGVSACCDGCHFKTGACNADSNGCTVNDTCSQGVCVAGTTAACSPGSDQCRDRYCVSTGTNSYNCVWDPAPHEGDPCNADSSGCTVGDRCVSGACVAGAAPDCSALNDQCKVGVCVSGGTSTYTCQASTSPLEGHSCNADSNGCTSGDKCHSGLCVAGSTPDCTAQDDACNTGYCQSTGTATYTCMKDPVPKHGYQCDSDRNGCTIDDRCASGICVAGAAADCSGADDQCNTGYCNSLGIDSFECLKNPTPWNGHLCNSDNNGCTVGDTCYYGACMTGEGPDCSWQNDQCNTGFCLSKGVHSYECIKDPSPSEGILCNADGNGCTVDDTCMAGECIAGSIPSCESADDQCNSGYCRSMNANSYACLKDPTPHDGRPCNADNSGCTIDDTCSAGACIAGSRPDCSAAGDQCNSGYCGSTGTNTFTCLKNPDPREGSPCNADDDGCTANDTCSSGSCVAGAQPDCSGVNDQCNTGYCLSLGPDQFNCAKNPAPLEGVPCNSDDSGCTVGDACSAGACVQGQYEHCYTAYDQCNAGYCESTGAYTMECRRNPAMFEGHWCNADDDGCTVDDKCLAGFCVPGWMPDCSSLDDSCNVGTCTATGTASFQCRRDPAPREGLACNADGNGCTVDDACSAGKCRAGTDAGCDRMDNGCTSWTCNSTGINAFECGLAWRAIDGASCNADSNGCTGDDSCLFGECLAGGAVDCSEAGDQCNTGFCSSTGPDGYECLRDSVPHEGAGCDADGSGCTVGDACAAGECLAGDAVDCSGMNDRCNTGYCGSTGPDTWVCLKDPAPHQGVPCDADGNGCTVDDSCADGTCTAGADADCTGMDDQCNAGKCDSTGPGTYTCSKDPGPLGGARCDADGDGCTVGDECLAGECFAGPGADCTGADDQCNTGYCGSTGADTFECLKDPLPLDGLACDADGSGCTVGDACAAGTCIAGIAPDCAAMDDQCNTGYCASTGVDTWECLRDPAPHDGGGCDADGNGCTVDDACVMGDCLAGAAADCTTANDQCNVGYCRSTAADLYECLKDSTPLHGKRCNADNSGCTINDTCSTGKCVAGGRPNCGGMNDQCNTGVCASTDVNAYECRRNPAPHEGKACNADGDGCTVNDTCSAGTCLVGAPADCSHLDDTCVIGRCGSTGAATFVCSADSVTVEGQACDDGIPCMVDETCRSGQCEGIARVCDDAIACTADSCDAGTGQCMFLPDSRGCDDANPCTTDECIAGSGCESASLADWSPCVDVGHGCFAGACEPLMPNDTCPTARELAPDEAIHQDFAGYHAYRPIPAGCPDGGLTGPDAYFSVATDPGVEYDVTVTADAGTLVAVVHLTGCGQGAGCISAGTASDGETVIHIPAGGHTGTALIQVLLLSGDDDAAAGFTIVVSVAEQAGDDTGGDDIAGDDIIETDTAATDVLGDSVVDVGGTDTAAGDTARADIAADTTRDSISADHAVNDLGPAEIADDDGNDGPDTSGGGSGCSAGHANSPGAIPALLLIIAISIRMFRWFRREEYATPRRP